MTIPKKCGDCKHHQRNFTEPCECVHKDSTKKGYEASVGLNDTPPTWCPLRIKDNIKQQIK